RRGKRKPARKPFAGLPGRPHRRTPRCTSRPASFRAERDAADPNASFPSLVDLVYRKNDTRYGGLALGRGRDNAETFTRRAGRDSHVQHVAFLALGDALADQHGREFRILHPLTAVGI